MKKSNLVVSISLAFGLTACGGGGGGGGGSTPPGATAPAPTPTPTTDVCANVPGVQTSVPPGYFQQGTNCTLTDACVNYDGLQTELEIEQKQFVRDINTGTCKLKMNHAALASSGLDIARMQGHTGKDVLISVIDNGFYPIHQEFQQRVNSGTRFKQINGQIFATDGDWETPAELSITDHGTRVASLVSGVRVGAAPESRLAVFFGDVDRATVVRRGGRVINESSSFFVDYVVRHSADEPEAILGGFLQAVKSSASVYVGTAANDRRDISLGLDAAQGELKSCLKNMGEKEHYLVVGSFDVAKKSLATYSGYPGHYSFVQERFLVAGDYLAEYAKSTAPDAYSTSYGTSLTAPIVSGALAILLEVNPRLSAIQAAQILLDTADRPASLGYGTTCTSTTPKGTFTTDCGAMKYGRGLMNVPKAIAQAKTM